MKHSPLVVCPFCNIEQEAVLAWKSLSPMDRTLFLVWTKPRQGIWRMWKSFKAVVFEGVEMSPALRCYHCHKFFVICPYCGDATTISDDATASFEQINCDNCKRPIDVSET